jgi:glycosyltransferase involved in cell wall biosynthesis
VLWYGRAVPAAARPAIAIVSREIAPAASGGIAVYASALARVLAGAADVTLLTAESQRASLAAAGPGAGVRMAYVPDPRDDGRGGFYGDDHRWSAAVLEQLAALYPDGGPDLVEFPDYRGEGAVTVQAVRTLDPRVARTRAVVRLHTSAELTSVLNGAVSEAFGATSVFGLERYALAGADRVLWAGGDILGTYERYYGADGLAPATRVRHPFDGLPAHAAPAPEPAGRLRLLYVGRLERRKGVAELLRAVTGLGRDDWTLTLVGGDTDTGALGASLREQLRLGIAGDDRIRLVDAAGREALDTLLADHDAVVLPSQWECWPYVGLEALAAGRPLIATPVGGLPEQVGAEPGEAGPGGIVAGDRTPEALRAVITRVLEDRTLLTRARPWARARELADPAEIAADYLALAAAPRRWASPAAPPARPLVSVIIPYHGLPEFVGDAVGSALAQEHEPIEVILVDDGSPEPLPPDVRALAETGRIRVLHQANSGLSAARNAGIRLARGEYVLPLDADNAIAPDFTTRCVAVLEAFGDLAYATSWLAAIDEAGAPHPEHLGERPLGNSLGLVRRQSVGGDAVAVLRRSLFDEGFSYDPFLTSFEDWMLYRDLHAAGRHGHVIPEPLVRYRVRRRSMVREIGTPFLARLQEEMHAHELAGRVRWTS